MKHSTLYRKWRPRAFSQIVGQEPIVRTLGRAIETDRVSHAYLFSGPRGTGKTSTAKVLAMGLNCEQGPTPEPCGKCDSCRAIMNNSSMDVVEMDAASNRGIDEIRDLRDRVNLAPASGRMKVYIIDEVHMLTAEAFNALLKMLEEPPEHVIFVLATTEKHKVLATIISRCQSFDFRRPGVPVIAEKLQEIAAAEEIEAEPEALTVIAGAGGGSFRDAEGLLDQLASFAEGPVTAAMVRELLGSVGSDTLVEMVYALHERRAADALRIVDRLSNEGRDPGQFLGELVSHLRNLMLLPHAPEVALASVGAEEKDSLQQQSEAVPPAEVVRMIEALGDCLGRMKRGGDPKLEADLAFLKLARDYTEPSIENLMSRLEKLERAVESGGFSAPARPEQSILHEDPAPVGDTPGPIPPEPEAGDEEQDSDGENDESEAGGAHLDWGAVLRELLERKQKTSETIFREASVASFDGESLELIFPEDQGDLLDLARDSRYLEPLQKVLQERAGVKPRLEMKVAGEAEAGTSVLPQEKPDGARTSGHGSTDEAYGPPPAPASETSEGPEASGSSEPEEPEPGRPEAANGSGMMGSAEADDKIRDEQEVFDLFRENRDSVKRDGGNL